MEKNRSKSEKQNAQKGKLAGVLLTGTLVVCCVALFVMSEQGSKLVGSFGAQGEAAMAQGTETNSPSALTCEQFIASCGENGLDLKLTKKASTARIESYAIEKRGNCEGEVKLSLSNDSVKAFTLSFIMPAYQNGNAKDESTVESMLTEHDRLVYSEYLDWFSQIYPPLAFALDTSGNLTYAHMDFALNSLKSALGEDVPVFASNDDFNLVISASPSQGACNVSVSLEKPLEKSK